MLILKNLGNGPFLQNVGGKPVIVREFSIICLQVREKPGKQII